MLRRAGNFEKKKKIIFVLKVQGEKFCIFLQSSGGIRYRQITTVVDANNTNYLSHSSQFYGY